jgi:hypothetical protein
MASAIGELLLLARVLHPAGAKRIRRTYCAQRSSGPVAVQKFSSGTHRVKIARQDGGFAQQTPETGRFAWSCGVKVQHVKRQRRHHQRTNVGVRVLKYVSWVCHAVGILSAKSPKTLQTAFYAHIGRCWR